jgi:hypothetical protein
VKKTTQVEFVKFRELGDINLTCSAIHSRHLSPRINPPSAFSDDVQLMVFGDDVSILGIGHDELRQPNAFVSGDYIQQVMIEILRSTQSSDKIDKNYHLD